MSFTNPLLHWFLTQTRSILRWEEIEPCPVLNSSPLCKFLFECAPTYFSSPLFFSLVQPEFVLIQLQKSKSQTMLFCFDVAETFKNYDPELFACEDRDISSLPFILIIYSQSLKQSSGLYHHTNSNVNMKICLKLSGNKKEKLHFNCRS